MILRAMPELPVDDPVVASLLADANLARLAYVGIDVRPRVVPIWFQYRDGAIVMITGPKAEKARALAANGAVALTIDSSQRRTRYCSCRETPHSRRLRGWRRSTRIS